MLSSADTALRNAITAHRAGRLTEAEVGYRRVLRKYPAEPTALYYLGLLHFHRGDARSGVEYVSRSLEHAPANGRAWNDLGGMLLSLGRAPEAKEAYGRAVEVAPESADGWYNLGICLRNEGDIEGAVEKLRAATLRQTNYSRAYDALASLLYQLGRSQEAAEIYLQWVVRDPGNPKARHMAAASSGQNTPPRASEEYIRDFFDNAAPDFDDTVGKLGYRAPETVAAALARWSAGRELVTVLDAGCGTGLCGGLIRAMCRTLVGLDLSERMIDKARARGCYDELVAAELVGFMRSRPNAFDAIVCVDTFVYFGALEDALAAARDALLASGLLIFTLEAAKTGECDHRLEFHGRYVHSEMYVRRAVATAGLELVALSLETLRSERLENVAGYVAVARRDQEPRRGS